jgi:hypothetical protein
MRLPGLIIPLLVAAALYGGYNLRLLFTQPTTNSTYNANDTKAGTKNIFIVDGIKCKGTAEYFSSLYDSVPGIIGIETFATERKAVITYDPDVITRDSIRAVMEKEIPFEDGTRGQLFKCISIE